MVRTGHAKGHSLTKHAISIIRFSTAQARAGRRCPCRPRAFSQHFPATKDAVIRPYHLSSQAVAAALRRSAGVILLELAFVCEKVAQEQVPQRRNTGPQIWLSAGRSPCGGTKKPRIFPRGLLEASLRHHMSPTKIQGTGQVMLTKEGRRGSRPATAAYVDSGHSRSTVRVWRSSCSDRSMTRVLGNHPWPSRNVKTNADES